ncbi:TonB-dependent receptor [Elizabethkingia sp. HX WHF]|uniref:TonB-dependent receptor n=1 Tax=Elizabethkingia bruuniana TaxID=1756149 RepID=A0A7T7ZZK9_9FLAO|nr:MULTISPECIES: TonB-dependent receptor [Elizabethkingia]ATL44275.1 TonB-dependent receptor [Elizabethkingia miricola]AQX86942.1 TonB-dependent receptor [Elizabethkingia bruuniana]KGO08249.1 TonB-dependent receptor [Elizabethkingia miricola]KUY26812.1 TonB-dependent receptor [Elizabethkingia bruuniana]MCL1639704.1 TonB-dependent receptor [Elizabethkingia bruuniana]
MKINFRKPMLAAVITLTTASVYYAQQTQDSTKSKSKDIEEVILKGVTDIAKDRKTPVAVSNIKAAQIVERQGNQELVEILNTTPSVYASKGGGGFGDSQINIRGFESRNIAVLVNGMPVNDMEGGTVYMSNWTGLSDVTSAMQVQRGLGSSKLAIASVGGTMNFLTRSADMKQGGVIRLGVGNNDFLKTSFAYNTGKSQNGWSSSFLMSRQAGSTFVQNTQYESYAYFFALGYQPSKKHNLQFMITSAPQWHNQRSTSNTISDYIKYNPDNDGTPDRSYNSDWGYRTMPDGRRVSIANKANYYSKPVLMLNWDWTISDKSTLSTVAYMSNGRGGGLSDQGKLNGKFASGYLDNTGHIDYDQIFKGNAAVDANTAAAGSTLIRRSSVNSHNWYGILMNFQHKINDNWNFSVGTDDRYYYGYHYMVATDLYGANGYKDDKNQNIAPNVIRNTYDYKKLAWNPFGGNQPPMSDRLSYSNDGEVLWYSGFGQIEYSTEKLTAYLQGSVSNQGYQRIDSFVKDGVTLLNGKLIGDPIPNTKPQQYYAATDSNPAVHTKTGFKNLFGFNVKGGVNYNIDDHHNVYANLGYYSKQPFMNSVYPSNKQFVNPALTNEKISSYEIGYGYRSAKFNATLNLYRTQWKDRWLRRSMQFDMGAAGIVSGYSELAGITEVHQGIEFEGTYKPFRFLEFNGMFSLGDYFYKGNATGANYDDANNPITVPGTDKNSSTLYLDGVKVGGSSFNSIPQMTSALGVTVRPVQDLSVYGTWRHVGKVYSGMDAGTFTKPGGSALKLPDFDLFDVGASYKIRLKDSKQFFTIGANVYNLFDLTYISDGGTNIKLTDKPANLADGSKNSQNLTYEQLGYVYKGIANGNKVYFGAPRTWAATVSFNF